jgi:hypothetical protein
MLTFYLFSHNQQVEKRHLPVLFHINIPTKDSQYNFFLGKRRNIQIVPLYVETTTKFFLFYSLDNNLAAKNLVVQI